MATKDKTYAHEAHVLAEVLHGRQPWGVDLYMGELMPALLTLIKQHNAKKGMTMGAFAKKAGVGRSTIENYSRKDAMRAKSFINLAKALGHDPLKLYEQLMRGDAIPDPTNSSNGTPRKYIVVEDFIAGFDLVATEFSLVPRSQRE